MAFALAISALVIGTTTASARLTDGRPLLAATPPMGSQWWLLNRGLLGAEIETSPADLGLRRADE